MQKHLREEIIIDYILGNLEREQTEQVKQHLELCNRCEQDLKNWQTMLGEQIEAKPSPLLHQRIEESVNEEWNSRQPKAGRMKKWYVVIGCAALLFLFVGIYNQLRSQDVSYQVAHNEEIEQGVLERKPDTNRVDVIPVMDRDQVHGNVWLNERSDEMLIEVNGLSPLSSQDYQLWIVDTNNDWNGEVLQIKNGMTRVYYQGWDVNHVKLMKVSVEPRGGSRIPTGPDTLFVDLEQ